MSTKITNNLKVHGENTTQKYTDAQYNTDTQRINGAQPGTPISSKLLNTGLRNATLVTSALIEALKIIVPNSNDLTTAITVGTATTHAALVTALTEALVKIKVETAFLADNVKSGAIVEETTTARESKQGFGISLGLNSKLQFKTTWLGTHKNNDILYYSAAGTLKGFYIVKGLSVETAEQTAGTLTITSGQTPTTHAANLQRLTFETAIGADAGLSKTDIINSSSTTNQLSTAKGVYDSIIKSGFTTPNITGVLTWDLLLGTEAFINVASSLIKINKTATKALRIGSDTEFLKFNADNSVEASTPLKVLFSPGIGPLGTQNGNVIDNITRNSETGAYTFTKSWMQPQIAADSLVKILATSNTAGVLNTLTRALTISSSSTHLELATAKSVYDTMIGDETLITTLQNGGTVLLSTLTAYRSIRIELRRKSANPSTGTFYGDVKEFKAENVLTRVEIVGSNSWGFKLGTDYDDEVIDSSIISSNSLIEYLNSVRPASGYQVGYVMRGTNGEEPINYYYAKVSKSTSTYMHGGIRLEQFDSSSLTFATFARTSNTAVTLTCNTNYELLIYGKL